MASPLHKLAHQHTLKGNGVSTRHNLMQQQRMPNFKPQGGSQQQMRFQNPQLRNSQQQQQRSHNPQQRHSPQRMQNLNMRIQAPLQNSQRFQAPSEKVFQKQTVDVAEDTEKLKTDQLRLSNLHTQLYSEAEKIRQWKSEKEMEVKQKERSLSDAIQTIDNLRKSIIELQFQNDEYNTKLSEKEKEKEETEQKLNTVRGMATVLRDQMVQLEGHIEKGVQDKEEVDKVTQRMVEENQGLADKFQKLDISQTDMIEKYSRQVQSMNEKHSYELNVLQEKIQHLEDQIISLSDIKKKQEGEIQDYSSKLNEATSTLRKLEEDFNANQDALQKLKESNDSLEQEYSVTKLSHSNLNLKYEETYSDLVATGERLKEVEEKNVKLKKHSNDIEDIYSKEINSLQSDLKETSTELQECQSTLKTLTEERQIIEKMITEMKNEKDKLSELQGELENEINAIRNENKERSEEKICLAQKLYERENELKVVNEHLGEQLEKQKTLEDRISILVVSEMNLKNDKESLKAQIDTLIKNFNDVCAQKDEAEVFIKKTQNELVVFTKTIEEKARELTTVQEEKRVIEDTLAENMTKLNEKCQEIKNLESALKEKDSLFENKVKEIVLARSEVETLTSKNSEQEDQLKLLMEKEQENADTLKSELAEREKESEDLGHQTKSLKSQISAKEKQLKNLEKENAKLKTQLKNKTDKYKDLEERLTVMEVDEKTLQESLQSKENSLENIKKEMKLAKDNFDHQQQNFCATLEKYKIENDNIVESHVKENRSLLVKLEELQQKSVQEVTGLKEEAAHSTSIIEDQRAKIIELQTAAAELKKKDTKLAELTSSVQSTSENLEQLSNENQSLKESNTQLADRISELETKCQENAKLKEELLILQHKLKHNEQLFEENSNLKNENKTLLETVKKLENKVSNLPSLTNSFGVVPTTPKTPAVERVVPITPSSNIRNSATSRGKRILFTGVSNNMMDIEEERQLSQKSTPKTPKLSQSSNRRTTTPSLTTPKPNVRFSPKPPSGVPNRYEGTGLENISPVKTIRKDLAQTPVLDRGVKKIMSNHIAAVKRDSPSGGPPRAKFLSTKMKKLNPKRKEKANLSWFDTDNVFTFDD